MYRCAKARGLPGCERSQMQKSVTITGAFRCQTKGNGECPLCLDFIIVEPKKIHDKNYVVPTAGRRMKDGDNLGMVITQG